MTTLEATMICLDNSEFMRNGDYPPNRWEVQKETVNALTKAKLDSNQEALVGILSMAGKRTQVHASPTRSEGEINKIMTKDVDLLGQSDVITAVKTAQLVLKNRQNKNLKQRVVVFVGSPVQQDEKSFKDLGNRLNKLGVSIDVINFGRENESNNEKLKTLVNAANGEGDKALDTSHFVYVPVGSGEFIDVVLSSNIQGASASNRRGGSGTVGGGGAGAAFGGGGGGGSAEDDELAMVLRMSMEEEYQRLAAANEGADSASASGATPMQEEDDEEEDDEEDEELQAALALSLTMNQDNQSSSATTASGSETKATSEEDSTAEAAKEKQDEDSVDDILRDEEFLQQLIAESGSTEMTLDELLDNDDGDNDGDE
jgi:26S proteasome regulatory subunit N10